MKLLVDRGASLNGTLGKAVQTGHDRIVGYLLERGEKPTWDLMTVLGSNGHPYESEQPERNFNRIADLLIKAGALDGLSEDDAARILRATTFTRNPGGNPVILKLLFDHGLRVDSRFAPPPEPKAAEAKGASQDGTTFLAMVKKYTKNGADGYTSISPETLKAIEEARVIQQNAK